MKSLSHAAPKQRPQQIRPDRRVRHNVAALVCGVLITGVACVAVRLNGAVRVTTRPGLAAAHVPVPHELAWRPFYRR